MAKNQLHAEQAEAEPHPSSVNRIQKRITLLNKQEKEIQQEIAKMAKEDLEVSSSIEVYPFYNRCRAINNSNGFGRDQWL